MPAYIAAFLDDMGRADPAKKNLYRCRVCGSDWERRAPEVRGEGRPSLVKIG